MTKTQNRIVLDPTILAGKPVVRGTRLSVEFVISLMADGWSEADIKANYPHLTHEDMLACLAYARDALSGERVFFDGGLRVRPDAWCRPGSSRAWKSTNPVGWIRTI